MPNPPFSADQIHLTPLTSPNIPLGETGIWINSVDGLLYIRKTDGSDVVAGIIINPQSTITNPFGGLEAATGITIKADTIPKELLFLGFTHVPGRYREGLVYDVARSKTVMFGGFGPTFFSTGFGMSDTREWDGTSWTLRNLTTSPSARYAHSMVYDNTRSKTVLFGGLVGSTTSSAETWEYNGTDWTQITPVSAPSARNSHSMAYDSARGKMVLFGGTNSGTTYLGDTWEYNGTNWTQISPVTNPSARFGHVMAYDSVRGKVVMFGGNAAGGGQNDTWEWNGTNWSSITTVTSPSAREFMAMTFDTGRSKILMVGGFLLPGNTTSNETWEYNGTNWTLITTSGSLPVGYDWRISYDSVRAVTVLFGGSTTNVPVSWISGQTWEYNGTTTTWSQKDGSASYMPCLIATDVTTPLQITNNGFNGINILRGNVGIGTVDPNALLHVAGNVILGAGDLSTPTTTTISGARASGTDIAGVQLTFAAINGTGTGGSGSIVWQTAQKGTTGSTANTLTNRLTLSANGNFAATGGAGIAAVGATPATVGASQNFLGGLGGTASTTSGGTAQAGGGFTWTGGQGGAAAASTNAAAAGGVFTFVCGKGGTGGASTAAGTGGAANLTGGAGGTDGGSGAGAGGAVAITAGAGGPAAGGSAGGAGSATFTAGAGGAGDSTHVGLVGGTLTSKGGAGGAGSSSTAAGIGGTSNLTGGAGGTDNGGGGNNGGASNVTGGAATGGGAGGLGGVFGGAGGAANSASNGGTGGGTFSTGGTGGVANSTHTAGGGGGGNLNGGVGGAASAAQAAGAGGSVVVVGGAAGSNAAGGGGANGGSVSINGGALSGAGTDGAVNIATTRGVVNLSTGTNAVAANGQWTYAKAITMPAGTNISSASTIAPTAYVTHITGTVQITTITIPYTGFKGTIVLIPDAIWTTATGGNIAIGTTAVVSRALYMTFDGTSWYPSYI